MSKSTAGGAGGAVGRSTGTQTYAVIQPGITGSDTLMTGPAAQLGESLASEWVKSLTDDEQFAIQSYKGSSYWDINGRLRNDQELLQDHKVIAKNLTRALGRGKLPENVIAWRGTDHPLFRKAVDSGDPSALVGQRFIDKGFVSASLNPAVARDFNHEKSQPVVFRIKIPKGAQAQYIDHSATRGQLKGERELLLNRGYEFQVTKYHGRFKKVGDVGSVHLYDLEIVGRPKPAAI